MLSGKKQFSDMSPFRNLSKDLDGLINESTLVKTLAMERNIFINIFFYNIASQEFFFN